MGQYRQCVAAGACSAPDSGGTCNWTAAAGQREDHPINCVDWDQARAFATWAGGRLPTESEWEFAARSRGLNHEYPSNQAPNCNRFHYSDCDPRSTIAVGSRPNGNTAQGLQDMAGNVWEWVEDQDCAYPSPADGSAARCMDEDRVRRGGGWQNMTQLVGVPTAHLLRAARRTSERPGRRHSSLGFRLAR